MAVDPCERITLRSGVRSAMHAASQLSGGSPPMWMMLLHQHGNKKHDDDDDYKKLREFLYINRLLTFQLQRNEVDTFKNLFT